ncbi:MAG: hypothetical protein K5841_06495, partial [Fretibacterium sp.]|nr:hypothetical protein [Fretibacterium sp.]
CGITTGLTLTLSAPQNLTYDGKAKEATLNTDYNKTAFPGTYAIEYWQGSTKLSAAPVNVGAYQARVTVGSATAALDFSIAGQTPQITISKTEKISNNFIKKTIQTTGQYIVLENNPNDISYMENGKIYVVRGNVTVGALVYSGKITLVLCKGAKLTVRAGIYRIESKTKVYTADGGEDSALDKLEVYTEDGGEDATLEVTGTSERPALSGNIALYGGNLTAAAAEGGKLFADDITLTIGAGVTIAGLTDGEGKNVTGGKVNEDGSTTFTFEELSNVGDKLITNPTHDTPDSPTSNKGSGGCNAGLSLAGLLALAGLVVARKH